MTRFEQLQRISSDERTEPRHIALFHAITESWVADGAKDSWEVDHKALMQLSKLKGSNYRKSLKELAEWGLIDYKPTSHRHVKTAINFRVTAPDIGVVNRVTAPESSAVKYCNPVTAPVFTTVTPFTAPESGAVDQVTTPECSAVKLFTAPESNTVSLFYRARIQRGNVICEHPNAILTKSAEKFGIVKTAHTNTLREIVLPDKVKRVIDLSGKRVQGKNQKSTSATPVTTGCRYVDSPLFDPALFAAAFENDEWCKGVDLTFYRECVLNWREKGTGAEPVRADWKYSAKQFMLNDYKKSELKMLTTTKSKSHVNDTRRNNGQPLIPVSAETKRSPSQW